MGVSLVTIRETAFTAVRPSGVIMHIGFGAGARGLDIRHLTLNEITLIGTYTYTANDFRACAGAMFEGRLGALDWFETRPLESGMQAFLEIRLDRVDAPKIILKP